MRETEILRKHKGLRLGFADGLVNYRSEGHGVPKPAGWDEQQAERERAAAIEAANARIRALNAQTSAGYVEPQQPAPPTVRASPVAPPAAPPAKPVDPSIGGAVNAIKKRLDVLRGLSRGAVIPGHDLSGRDDVPAYLTRGEAVLPVKTVDALGGPEVVEELIRRTNGKEPAKGLRRGGEYRVGAVDWIKDVVGRVRKPSAPAAPNTPAPPTWSQVAGEGAPGAPALEMFEELAGSPAAERYGVDRDSKKFNRIPKRARMAAPNPAPTFAPPKGVGMGGPGRYDLSGGPNGLRRAAPATAGGTAPAVGGGGGRWFGSLLKGGLAFAPVIGAVEAAADSPENVRKLGDSIGADTSTNGGRVATNTVNFLTKTGDAATLGLAGRFGRALADQAETSAVPSLGQAMWDTAKGVRQDIWQGVSDWWSKPASGASAPASTPLSSAGGTTPPADGGGAVPPAGGDSVPPAGGGESSYNPRAASRSKGLFAASMGPANAVWANSLSDEHGAPISSTDVGNGIVRTTLRDGSTVFSGGSASNAPYVAADGTPTSDWTKTAAYAEGLRRAEKDKLEAALLDYGESMRTQSGAAGEREKQGAIARARLGLRMAEAQYGAKHGLTAKDLLDLQKWQYQQNVDARKTAYDQEKDMTKRLGELIQARYEMADPKDPTKTVRDLAREQRTTAFMRAALPQILAERDPSRQQQLIEEAFTKADLNELMQSGEKNLLGKVTDFIGMTDEQQRTNRPVSVKEIVTPSIGEAATNASVAWYAPFAGKPHVRTSTGDLIPVDAFKRSPEMWASFLQRLTPAQRKQIGE